MIGDRKVLGLITARGGSKGLPGKNILPVNGRPLLAWTIDAARDARSIDRVVLSSEDDTIMAVARTWGCDVPFRRPAELASDTATSIDVVLHALAELPGYDVLVLLQPTSPLRTSADIDAACEKMVQSGAPACVSVCDVEQTPFWMYYLEEDQSLRPVIDVPAGGFSRRQELPAVYMLNGAIYVAGIDWLRKQRTFVTRETVGYVMPVGRSIDIDTREDFEVFRKSVSAC